MFSTKSTQSLKKLFAGYHEPAALNKQHSQRLLDGLKTSFRGHLDREYGQSPSTPSTKPSATGLTNPSRRSPTHQHLKSILTNPLFSYDASSPAPLQHAQPTITRDPMDVFEQATAKGMMTISAATGCLVARNKSARLRSAMFPEEATRTARCVVDWLHASSEMKDMRFLTNYAFIKALMPVLVESGRGADVVWEWLSQSVDSSLPPAAISHLLLRLVLQKAHPREGNLDSCIATLLRAERLFRKRSDAPDLLVRPWQAVSWLSTVQASMRQPASADLFDAHVETGSRLPGTFSVENAHLKLLHPKHPTTEPAVELFHDKIGLVRRLSDPIKGLPMPISIGAWVSSLGQDTANLLRQSGRDDEAQEIARFLDLDVPELLGRVTQPT